MKVRISPEFLLNQADTQPACGRHWELARRLQQRWLHLCG